MPLHPIAACVNPWAEKIKFHANETKLRPSLVGALVAQESSGKARAFRHEPGFYKRYLPGIQKLLQNTPRSHLIADSKRVASSYGLLQGMFISLVEIGFPGEPEELYDPDTNLHWGCRLFVRKMRAAKGDLTGGLLRWNGGGRPAYAPEVLAKLAIIESSGILA